MAIVLSGVNNNDKITASDGTIDLLSGVNFVSEITVPSFKVGSNIQFGNAGIITATTLVGNVTGNINHTSNLLLQISGSEKFRVASSGQLGIGGANYGSAGQVLTSGGSGSAATWSTISSTTLKDSGDNTRVSGTLTGAVVTGILTATASMNVKQSGNAYLNLLSTGTGNAGIYMDASNGDIAGSDYCSIYQKNDLDLAITNRKNTASIIFETGGENERLRISSNGDMRIGGGVPSTFGSGTTVHETYNASTYTANLVTSGTHILQMIASQTHGATSIGTRSNHNLNLCANDSTKVTIDTQGRLLLGTTTEGQDDADNLTIDGSGEGTGRTGITIRSATNTFGSIFFSDATSGAGEYDGVIAYDHSTQTMRFSTASTQRMFINTNGIVTKPYQYVFMVSTSGTSKAANWAKVTGFAPVSAQCTGVSDGTYWSNSNQQFSAPVTGVYHFYVGGWTSPNSNGSRYAYSFRHTNGNNLTYIGGGDYCTADSPMAGWSRTIKLSAGEWVELWMYSAITATLGGGHHFYWGGYLLG